MDNQKNQQVNIVPYLVELTKYMEKRGLKVRPAPKVIFSKESQDPLFGKTAYYTPENNSITLFTEGRLAKDILRSFTHEMIHCHQHHSGKLDNNENANDKNYAQNNKKLRYLEAEAYLKGNLILRDWTDTRNT